MRLAAAALLALAVSGCGNTVVNPDLSMLVSTLDCRPFSACWAVSCPCVRATLSSCLLCDPALGPGCGDCSNVDGGAARCVEQAQECAGRSPSVCPGQGARCLPAGSSCANLMSPMSGDPPDQVPLSGGDPDAGPATEPRCTFVDDVCCPGAGAPIDLGGAIDANLDAGVSD